MALQILQPLPTVLDQITRVLRPHCRMIAIAPSHTPLRWRDYPVLTGLLTALGRGLTYPNDRSLLRPEPLLELAGLQLVSDKQRLFVYRLAAAEEADRLCGSLYLPGLSERRRLTARRWLRATALLRIGFPVPIRRIIAERIDDTWPW